MTASLDSLSEALALVEGARAIGVLVENPSPEQTEIQKRMRDRALQLLMEWKAPVPPAAEKPEDWRRMSIRERLVRMRFPSATPVSVLAFAGSLSPDESAVKDAESVFTSLGYVMVKRVDAEPNTSMHDVWERKLP